MTESSKYKDRIRFLSSGVQGHFIVKAEEKLGITKHELAKILKISERTLREWKKERIKISVTAAEKISKLTNLSIPKNHQIISWKLHLQKAGKVGGIKIVKKYGSVGGNIKYRKEKWKEWWKQTGQFKKPAKGFQTIKKVKSPSQNEELAEFVGIMLGDGGISKYHINITLSALEKPYIHFVSKLVNKLFNVKSKIYKLKYAKAIDIVVNRKEMVTFCQGVGLVVGNKVRQQIDIPNWIKDSTEFSKSCLRGLVDTDGCFYLNSYVVNGKKYQYFKIAFTSASKPLIRSVHKILSKLEIQARINKGMRDVRIESSEFVLKYINLINSHNEKHLEKIKKWKSSKNMLE